MWCAVAPSTVVDHFTLLDELVQDGVDGRALAADALANALLRAARYLANERQDVRLELVRFVRDILAMSDEEFRAAFKGSPMKRAKLRGLKRNAAVVLGEPGHA